MKLISLSDVNMYKTDRLFSQLPQVCQFQTILFELFWMDNFHSRYIHYVRKKKKKKKLLNSKSQNVLESVFYFLLFFSPINCQVTELEQLTMLSFWWEISSSLCLKTSIKYRISIYIIQEPLYYLDLNLPIDTIKNCFLYSNTHRVWLLSPVCQLLGLPSE